jgi:hypothetical protein
LVPASVLFFGLIVMKQRDSEFALLIAGHGLECCGFAHPGELGIHQADLEQDAKPNHGLECRSTPDLQQMQIRVCVPGSLLFVLLQSHLHCFQEWSAPAHHHQHGTRKNMRPCFENMRPCFESMISIVFTR